ncbi:helicase-exonuclease AddAB subunit AddA [Paenibacillus sp. ACRRX]|uniref:helicase-exonuclease AddAB subunit AddA n=1 Tax=Paenibacillus sp. ACRRX TaxID=2918206 RepID=UPI001EF6F47D|nr:helicase-exonuclease AddAB subunit AddA [Paenibacillus sp. ACRRX]MCG7407859.1 helicase-exonuclease AddAB subunit AddA [Paenibacillus sp. ACRRX]
MSDTDKQGHAALSLDRLDDVDVNVETRGSNDVGTVRELIITDAELQKNAVHQSEHEQIAVSLPPKPIGSKWTDEQWRAVVDGGRHILVAAAAGSGKTAVLVERIIRKISDESNPVHVDQLLVATFTKAAAAEMRERIRLALEGALELNAESEHLQRQLALLNRASITTLHSFCLEVIQRYFQTIGLDPAFRVANATETEVIRQDVLQDLFEELYAEEDELFRRLVDWFSGERNDEAAFRLIQRLYDFSHSHPWPNEWISGMVTSFKAQSIEELSHTPWAESVMKDTRLGLNAVVELLRQALQLTTAPGGPEPYQAALQPELEAARAIMEAAERLPWHEMSGSIEQLEFGRLAACRGDKYDKSLQEQTKRLRDQAKARYQQLREELYRRTPAQFLKELHEMAPLMDKMAGVVKAFGERYELAKRAKGLLDFSDLEHYCLRILRTKDSTAARTLPSDAALQYREQFVEILLDEYQDTNMVQEAIVNLITRDGVGNRFMVGDVKQSIYRFRLAEPGLFLAKYESYRPGREGEGTRIDLARNFRSRKQVVDAVNMLFRQVMNKQVAELEYDQAAELQFGAAYYPESSDSAGEPQSVAAELLLIEKGSRVEAVHEEDDDVAVDEVMADHPTAPAVDAAELETARLEARAIAARIRRMLGDEGESPYLIFDGKLQRMRPVTYRDVVILLRATSAWAPLMVEELRLEGIPAYAEFSTGYFQATEVEVMVSLLRVIDNPYQDIPLAGVLRSPIVGLTAEELAQVRLHGSNMPYADALQLAADEPIETPAGDGSLPHDETGHTRGQPHLSMSTRNRIRSFLQQLENWRNESRQGSLSELIWRIYRETGYFEWIGGLAGGTQRQANLRALYDRARQYEASSVRGLFRFLRFIDRMRGTGGDLGTARALGEQEDVVRIMTIHKSKGLEFPVVFVAGLAKMFNQQDLNASFLMHKQLGFGPKYVDEATRVTYPTLANLAIRRQMKLELLAEEQRVLYVALTRPKEKLILVGTVSDAVKEIRQWGEALDINEMLLPDYMIARARSYLDWIGPAIIRHAAAADWRNYAGLPNRNGECMLEETAQWKLSIVSASVLALQLDTSAEDTLPQVMAEQLERLVQLDEWAEVEDPSNPSFRPFIEERLGWRNPYRIAELLPAKTSVTEMKRLFTQEEWPESSWVQAVGDDGQDEKDPMAGYTLQLRRPRFMENTRLTAAERGTAYHFLMQHLPLDLQAGMTTDIIKATIAVMVERDLMSQPQADAIDANAVQAFFEHDMGRRLLGSKLVYREMPFSYGLTATEAYAIEMNQVETDMGDKLRFVATSTFAARDDAGLLDHETVLVQGVIDCLFEHEGKLILLDFKTDRVRAARGGVQALVDHYRFQLGLYARAIEKIWKRPVDVQVLYFFDAKEAHIL